MKTTPKITEDEWYELAELKSAISINPASVHPDEMEKFTELFVKTLPRTDYDSNKMVTNDTDSY
jgi:hypothetical protein